MALWFSVVLNVNLALLNLLPIPVLDGGHIMLALVEGGAAAPGQHAGARSRANRVRGPDHRLHGLHRLLRCAGPVWGPPRYAKIFAESAGRRIAALSSAIHCTPARRPLFCVVDTRMTTTAFELDGYRIVKTFGVVRGIIVRSRSIFGTIGAGLQTLVGGNITILTDLCEKTREHALEVLFGARTPAWCKRNHWFALRCDRNHAGGDRSFVLRHGRVGRAEQPRVR